MVYIFGGEYSLTLVMPVVLILIILIFFLTTYLRDNIGKLKLKLKKKRKKEEKKIIIDFPREFAKLKRDVINLSANDALDEISGLIKKYIAYTLNIEKEFAFEELPRDKLDWPVIEFTKRLSDLKYSGREVTRQEIDHLLLYLSKILKTVHEKKEKEKQSMLKLPVFPKIILPKFPKIKINFPKRKHVHHVEEESKPSKPIKIRLPLPKKITINLMGLFREKEHKRKPVAEHEILERQQRIISLINLIRRNIADTGRALKYCKRAIEIDRTLPKHNYSSQLKILHDEILKEKDKSIKSREIEIQRNIKIREEKKLSRIRNKILDRIKSAQKSINNYDKALLFYKKSFELSKNLPKSEFRDELKSLYDDIISIKQKQIKLTQREEESKIKNKELERQQKLRLEQERQRQLRQKEIEKGEQIKKEQLGREREIRQKEQEREKLIRERQIERERKIRLIEEGRRKKELEKQESLKQRQLQRENEIRLREKERRERIELEQEAKKRKEREEELQRQQELKLQEERERARKEAEKEKISHLRDEQLEREKLIQLRKKERERLLNQDEAERRKRIQLNEQERKRKLELKKKLKERHIQLRQEERERNIKLREEDIKQRRQKELERQRQIREEQLEREKEKRHNELENQRRLRLQELERQKLLRQNEIEKHNKIKLMHEDRKKRLELKRKAREEEIKLREEKQKQAKLNELERQKQIKLKREEKLKSIKLEHEAKLKEINLRKELRERALKRAREEKELVLKQKEQERQRQLKINQLRREKEIKIEEAERERKEKEIQIREKINEQEKLKKLKDHILHLINYTEQNITNTNRALKYYNKALRLNRTLSGQGFTARLNELHKAMLTTQEKKIKLEQEAKLRAIQEDKKQEQRKIKFEQEAKERAEKGQERKLKLRELENQKKFKLREEIEKQKIQEELKKQKRIGHEQLEKERQQKIRQEEKEKELRRKQIEYEHKIQLGKEAELKIIKERKEARERKERERQQKIKLKQEARERKEKEIQRRSELKEQERKRRLNLVKEAKQKEVENSILRLIRYSEQSLTNLKPKIALRYQKKALDLDSNVNKFNARLKKLHEKIMEYQQKPKEIPIPKIGEAPTKKHIKHHKKHKSLFENIRINNDAKRVLKLIKRAERLSLKYPLISKKYYDRALMLYYNLPIEKEENISIKLSRYYDRVGGNDEKELLNIKHESRKSAKEAINHLKKYRNYVVIEQNSFRENLRNSVYDVKKHALVHMNRTKHRKTKHNLRKFIDALSREENKLYNLEENAVTNLLNRALSLFREMPEKESKEAFNANKSAINLFSHMKVQHNIPRIPEPREERESLPVMQRPDLAAEVKIRPPKVVEKPRIDIEPPKLPNKKISEKMQKLVEEKESVYNKLKELEEKELDRFKQTRRMTTHNEIGYTDFIKNIKKRSDIPEEKRMKKLFEAE